MVAPSFRTPYSGFGHYHCYPPETDPPRKEPPEMVVFGKAIVAGQRNILYAIETSQILLLYEMLDTLVNTKRVERITQCTENLLGGMVQRVHFVLPSR